MSRQEIEEGQVLKALAQAKVNGDEQEMAVVHLQLGHLHKKAGQLERAGAAYQRACVLAKKSGNAQLEADAYSGWGLLCEVQGNLEQAWEQLMASYEINKTNEDRVRLADNYSNLGFIAQMQGDFVDAEHLYGYALHLREELADQAGRAVDYGNLGNLFFARDQLDRALEYLRRVSKYIPSPRRPRRYGQPVSKPRPRIHEFKAKWPTPRHCCTKRWP